MSAIGMVTRAELRARWRATLGLVLLVGIVSGAAMAAAAGARRTDSAYPRFLERYSYFDTQVSTPDARGAHGTDEFFAEIAQFPEVVETSRESLFFASLAAGGHTVAFPDVLLIAPHTSTRLGPGGAKVLRGRLPDPDAVDEAAANYAFAERLGLEPGDRLSLELAPTPDQLGRPGTQTAELELVGVVAAAGSFETLTGRGFPNIVVSTPAFFEAHRDLVSTDDDTLSVALRHDEADLPAFAEELRRREIPVDSPPQPASALTSDVQAVNRVPVVTLWVAAGLLVAMAAAIVGQTLAREAAARGETFPTFRALGMGRGALTTVSMAKVGVVGVGGAVVGIAVALLASPLAPLGVARIAEPDPGFDADWVALGVGATVTVLLVCAAGAAPARRASRAGVQRGRARPSLVARGVERAGLPVSVTAGVRFALRGAGATEPVPARAAFLGTAFAIAAVTAALVFAASLTQLVSEPRLFGYAWDAAVAPLEATPDEIAASLPDDLVGESWSGTFFDGVEVDGRTLDVFATDGPPPSIIEGRAPEGPDEIALDPRSLDQLDKAVGDTVAVVGVPSGQEGDPAPAPRRMHVVGSFAVPRMPFQSDERAAQGVALSAAGWEVVSGDGPLRALYLTFAPGVDPIDGVQRLRNATAGQAFSVVSPQRLGAVRSVQRISGAPWVLAGVLGVLAVGALTHTLLVTIRRRRRDLAVLKTVGFVGRQVRATVAWFAVAIVAPALVVGVPVGIVVGRWGWRRFATYLAVVPEPSASARGVLLVAIATIAVAGLIALVPAHLAARIRPATTLRSE